MTLIETMARTMYGLMIQRAAIAFQQEGGDLPTWEGESDQLHADWIDAAREGLKSARAPTDRMVREGSGQIPGETDATTSDDAALRVWQEMVDAEIRA